MISVPRLARAAALPVLLLSALAPAAHSAQAPTKPALRAATNTVVWGDVAVGTSSATKNVIFGNGGAGQLRMSATSVSGSNASDFAVTADSCTGRTLASGEICAVSLRFTPGAPSTRVGMLTVRTAYAGCALYLPLAGTGAMSSGAEPDEPRGGLAKTCDAAPAVTTPPVTGDSGVSQPAGSGGSTQVVVLGESDGGGVTVCRSSRKVRVHVRPPRGASFRRGSVRVRFNGKDVRLRRTSKGKRAGQYSGVLDFSGLARKRYAVKLRGKLDGGGTYRRTRYFVTCTAGR